MHSRSERRAKKALMKRKARKIYSFMEKPEKLADHLKCCSCFMCGNPRKWWKEPSLKEEQFKSISIDID